MNAFHLQLALFKIGLLNVVRNKGRSLATLSAITIGFCGSLMIANFIKRIERGITHGMIHLGQAGDLVIFKKSGLTKFQQNIKVYGLAEKDILLLRNHLKRYEDQIEDVVERLPLQGLLSTGSRSFPAYFYGINFPRYVKDYYSAEVIRWARDWRPKTLNTQVMLENPLSTVLATGISELVGEQNREIQVAIKDYYGDFNVLDADFENTYTSGNVFTDMLFVLVPVELLQKGLRHRVAQNLTLFLRDGSKATAFKAELDDYFQKNSMDYDVYVFGDERWTPYFTGTMGFLWTMTFFLSFLLLGASLLAIVNTINLNILERSREQGTLVSFGYLKIHIRRIFIYETFFLSLAGILLGGILCFFLSRLISESNIQFRSPGQPHPNVFFIPFFWDLFFKIAFVFISSSMIATAWSLRKQLNKRPVELLGDKGV